MVLVQQHRQGGALGREEESSEAEQRQGCDEEADVPGEQSRPEKEREQ
jgi:hypothetical protein